MVTLDDVAEVVKARCAAAPRFAAALPGGAWFGRGPDEPAGNYAVFTLAAEGDAAVESDGSFTQTYGLRIGAYSYQGAAEATSSAAAQLALAAALGADPTDWDALRDGRVMHCLPRGFDGKFDPAQRDGRDVFVSGGRWALLIEGNAEA